MHKLFLPSFDGYTKRDLKRDLIAALIVTAIAVPESLAFAAIVGLPLQAGLYTAIFAPIVFALFSQTKRLIVGADSATAALVASGAGLVAVAGTAGYANAIVVLGLITGCVLIVMGLARFGFLSNLISRPVLVGFLAGVGIQLMITKLPEMLGLQADGSLFQKLLVAVNQFGSINGMTVTISFLVVGLVVVLGRSRYPGALIGIVAATLFAYIFHVADYGVGLIGALPAGLPSIPAPQFTMGMVVTLFPVALSIAIVIIAQSSAVIRSMAGEHDEKVRINQDLLALGLANIVSSLTRGFAVNGSPPRSLASDMAGARSQMVNIFMGILIALLLVFGAHLFVYMPQAALSAVVFMIGVHLIRVRELRYIWHTHRTEFFVAMISLFGVALFGVQQGVLIAVIVSLMERLSRQYHPKDQILLRDGKLSEWAKERIEAHHRHQSSPTGLLVYSFDGSLFFENITYFVYRIEQAIAKAEQPVTSLVVDAGAIESIDYTAVEYMKLLYRHLSADNISFSFAHVSPDLREQFDQFGMTNLLGQDNIYPTLNAAISAQPGSQRSAIDMVKLLDPPAGSYVVIGGGVMEELGLRDARDIDLVVSVAVYNRHRDHDKWKEYVQDNGKKILSHKGYNIMQSWMGRNLKVLQKDAFTHEGVAFMSVKQLIECKRHLGRRKDLADIKLLEEYKKHHHPVT